MMISKKFAAMTLWIVTTAVAHGTTIHGGPSNNPVADISTETKQSDPAVYYLSCASMLRYIFPDEISINWETSDGDVGTSSGCILDTDMTVPNPVNRYAVVHHRPKWIKAHISYTGSALQKIFLKESDENNAQIHGHISDLIVLPGNSTPTCSVNVPPSISFDHVKTGDALAKSLTDNGQGQGILTFQPDHYNTTGGTIVNGSSTIEYDVNGVGWNPSLNQYETNDIITPHEIELKPSGNLAAGAYTGKMVVTITCN